MESAQGGNRKSDKGRSEIITVVIPAFNAANTLAAQLEALSSQADAPEFSIIVVNNGSTDATEHIALSFDARAIPLTIVEEPRRGINLARNAGVQHASDGVILMCDADDVVSPRWVRTLADAVTYEHWATGPTYLIRAQPAEKLDQRNAFTFYIPDTWRDDYVQTSGCNCAFRKSLWETVGGFDNRLSGEGDELEFFNRAFQRGYKPRVVPEAFVLYRVRPQSSLMSEMRTQFNRGFSHFLTSRCPGGGLYQRESRSWVALLQCGRAVMSGLKHGWSASGRRAWLSSVAYWTARVISPIMMSQLAAGVIARRPSRIGEQVSRWLTYSPPVPAPESEFSSDQMSRR